MQHHFDDLLNRDYGHWQICFNRERYAYFLPDKIADKQAVKIVTITGEMPHWQEIFSLPNLEEITLHTPKKEQVLAISQLKSIKRLRISQVRLSNIEFIRELCQLEELVFEYVSGFSDLSPLQSLQNLTAIHLENLRKVNDFSPLGGVKNLRYLAIFGTLDWNQTIDNFEFLKDLTHLEYLRASWCKVNAPSPVFGAVRHLKNLKNLMLSPNCFYLEDFAFLELIFPHNDTQYPLIKKIDGSENLYFLGKGARSIKESSKTAEKRIADFKEEYENLKKEWREKLSL